MKSSIFTLAFTGAMLFSAIFGSSSFATTHSYGVDLPAPNGGGDYAGTKDTFIANGATVAGEEPFWKPDTNWNASGWVGSYSTTDNNQVNIASLVRFEDLSIPAGSTINSVTLSLFKVADWQWEDDNNSDPRTGPGFTINVAGLLAPWGEGIGSAVEQAKDNAGEQWLDGGATMNHRVRPDSFNSSGFSAWNEPMALAQAPNYSASSYDSVFDRGPVDATHFFAANQKSVEGYVDFDVTTTFADQFAKDKLYGWILHTSLGPASGADPGASDGKLSFRDWEVGLDNTGPKLIVDFTAPVGQAGDFDNDGDVDGSDFLDWQRNDKTPGGLTDWQNAYPSSLAVIGAVPEPTSLTLLLAAGITAYASRRNRM